MMRNKGETSHLIELRGVYDGWSVQVLMDGTLVNRWLDPETGEAYPGYERRAEITQAFIDGEESNGRWF